MTKTFTQTDLIRFLYRETSEEENQEINKALLCDGELRALYTSMCAIKTEMDHARMNPSPETVLNILSYSRSTAPVKH